MKDWIHRGLRARAEPDPPPPRWPDWLLVAALVVTSLLEVTLRDDVGWPAVSFMASVLLVCVLPWRRTHPLGTTAISFGAVTVLNVLTLIGGVEQVGLYSMAALLLTAYALFRWGSGRDAALGSVLILLTVTTGIAADWSGFGDAIGGVVVVCVPIVLGLEIRHLSGMMEGQREQVRILEREQLARELHDTVAHHVSAIAIQAQAGRTVAASDPDAAVTALETIETAAAETLEEMRAMVRILRDSDPAELGPRGGIADLDRLADRNGHGPRIDVELCGDLRDLAPPVDAAVYRLVQESVTNAIRHSRDASTIDVVLTGHDEVVHLIVHDDGSNSNPARQRPAGLGITGMTERARLLGGVCEAGPDSAGGWTVTAAIPRTGASA